MEWVSGHFGVPLAQEKTEGPCTVLSFLGILIDSRKMECRLPDDKLLLLKQEVSRIGKLRKVTLKELQSLLGRLNFACRIMPMGRIFCRRLSRATAGVRAAHHFIRLSREHKDDLLVWQRFLENYNGRSLIQQEDLNAFDCEIYTDAAGGAGYGAYCAGKWSVGVWPEEWRQNGLTKNLALLELFPIVVAAFIWGENFKDRRVRFHCDNLSVVSVINSLSSSSPPVISGTDSGNWRQIRNLQERDVLRICGRLLRKGRSLDTGLTVEQDMVGLCSGVGDVGRRRGEWPPGDGVGVRKIEYGKDPVLAIRGHALATLPWIFGFTISLFPTVETFILDFCGPNKINHFFCDLAPLQNLSCSDPLISNMTTIVAAFISIVMPFFVIVGFYINIIYTVLKIDSKDGKAKAFSTCSSHLIVASLFYGSAIIVYVKPKGRHFDKFLALTYTVVTPLLNPFIYTLRNKKVVIAFRKVTRHIQSQ
ncbi:unnamed protein product [Ranitomeya imitator]|uniref:G-protein coupled receptors family 1 profile domain-containing protein n=1 Tax=Ranitomeya imitator TaxID=111125 RepID=A0ABN9KV84_9NEOB|nr:unnamed protein product [Ranitomeya imitator]